VLDGNPVGEDQHAAAGGDGVGRLGDGVRAGHGDDRQGGVAGRQRLESGADRAVRDGVGAARGALALGQCGVDGGDRGGQRGVVLGADGDEQLLGRGDLVRGEAHVAGELEVERGRHRDDHPGHSRQCGHGAAHLHQAY
jgi:hypothetical protein